MGKTKAASSPIIKSSNGVAASTRSRNLEGAESEECLSVKNRKQADQLDGKQKPLDFPVPFGQTQVCLFLHSLECFLLFVRDIDIHFDFFWNKQNFFRK